MEVSIKSYAIKNLEKIHLAEEALTNLSNSLIKDIQNMSMRALEKLEHLKQTIEHTLENESEFLLIIPEIEEISRNIRMLEVQISFTGSERSKDYSGKTEKMNLKAKIDYFLPTLIQHWLFEKSEYCYERIKQILVSNDGKYFFACKLYLDFNIGTIGRKIYSVSVWDLQTKNLLGRWYYDHEDGMKEIRKWCDKYPECALEIWGYKIKNLIS